MLKMLNFLHGVIYILQHLPGVPSHSAKFDENGAMTSAQSERKCILRAAHLPINASASSVLKPNRSYLLFGNMC